MDTPRIFSQNLQIRSGMGLTTYNGNFEVAPDVRATELSGQTFHLDLGYSHAANVGPLRLQAGGGAFYQFSTGYGATDLDNVFGTPIVWGGVVSQGPGVYVEASAGLHLNSSIALFLNLRGSLQYSNGASGENVMGSLNPLLGFRLIPNPKLSIDLAGGPLWCSDLQGSGITCNGVMFQIGTLWGLGR